MRAQAIPVLAVVLATATIVRAQTDTATEPIRPVEAEERQAVVETIATMLGARYVFPNVARKAGADLHARLEAGDLDDASDPEEFAGRLTTMLQAVTHDRHLRVRALPPARAQMEQTQPARARGRNMDRMQFENYGFRTVQRLDGNVGYIDLRHFAGAPEARATAAAAMNFLAHVDAIIFDMRQNGGGSPDMVRFLSSYLFAEPTHLNSLYWREGDVTEDFWTLPEVPGPRLADVPAFVLTSGFTFSGAEEFSYNLRTRERATLIGAVTGGGANPGGRFPVNERFAMFIPTGRAINPVTGTNWEGTGVEPHVVVDADDAYDVAIEQAQAAAERRRQERDERRAARWAAFEDARVEADGQAADGKTEDAAATLTAALASAADAGLLGEMEINMLGYEYLGDGEVDLAIATFAYNVKTHPESANVYDSLGEAWMEKGDHTRAIRWYRRSLELDPKNANAEAMIRRMRGE